MVTLLLIVAGSISLMFFQSLLNALGAFSLLLVIAIFAYSRMRLIAFVVLVLPASLLNDVYFSYPVGFTFLLLVIASLAFKSVSKLLPSSNHIVELLTVVAIFMGYHLLFAGLLGLFDITASGLNLGVFISAVKFSFIETVFYFILKVVSSKIGTDQRGTIKL